MEQYPYFPRFDTYLPPYDPSVSATPTRQLPAAVPATGTGDWLTSGVMAGFHGAVSEGARALQAAAQMVGAPGAAQSLSDFAEEHHRREQSYARPDLEASPWSSPAGIGYQVARTVPTLIAALGGGAAATAAAPELAGAGLLGAAGTMFLPAAGANVQRQISETSELTTPGKALALGVPEAIVQGYLPGRLEKFFGKSILEGIKHSIVAQGFAGSVTEFLTQQLGDPNRDLADRAAAIAQAGLSGAALGGIIGGTFGGMRALVGKPAQEVLNDPKATAGAVDRAIEPPKPGPEPEQLPLPLPRVPEGLQDLPLFARRPAEAPTAPPVEAPAAAAAAPPAPEPAAPAAAEPAAPAAPEPVVPEPVAAEPAEPVPVLDFTKGAVKSGGELYRESGRSPDDQAKMRQPLMDEIIKRAAEGKEPTKLQKRWADELDIWDELEKAVPKLPLEVPPGVAPEAGTSADRVRAAYEEVVGEQDPPTPQVSISEVAKRSGLPPEQVRDELLAASKNGDALLHPGTRGDEPSIVHRDGEPMVDVEFKPKSEVQPGERLGYVSAGVTRRQRWTLGEPAKALLEAPVVPPPASTTPIKTAEDRAAALNGVAAHIDRLPDSEIRKQHLAEAQAVAKLLPLAEGNPGLEPKLNDRLDNLRAAVEAAGQRPSDAAASPDLAPSPRAEAVPAPTGDFGKRLEDAQSALSNLKKVLGGRPEVVVAIKQHSEWLADANKATGPEELRAVLAKDPELNPDADNLGNLGQISKSQQKKVSEYLTTQHEAVLQGLQADSNSRARVVTSRDGLPVRQLDADVTDLHQRGVPLTDVADHIIEHTPDSEEAEIVAKLKPFLPKDAKTVYRDGVTDKQGEYFTKQKTSALYDAADAARTAVHEMVHAVTHQALEGDSAAARTMRGIYDQLKDTGNHAGITDAHEMVAEAYSNPTFREFLKSQLVRGTSLWDRFVDTVRGFIGLDPRLFNAFDRIMSHGDDLMKEQRAYPNSEWMGPDSYARVANKGAGTAAAAADSADRSLSEKLANGMLDVKSFLRMAKGWSPGQWLARNPVYNKLSPNIQEYVNSLGAEDPRKKQIGKAAIVADRQARALPAEGREILNQLMAASTSYGFHPERSLADYPDIHDNPTRVQQFNATKDLWGQLGQIPSGQEVYNTWRSVMSTLGHMTAMHNLQSVGRQINGLPVRDSFREFDGRSGLTNQPKLRDAYWQKELNDEIKSYTSFKDQLSAQKATVDTALAGIEFKKDQPKELVKQSRDLDSQIDRLGEAIKLATDEQKRMFKEPYFHLGRKGDYFATGKLITTPGEIDEETGEPGKLVVDQDVLSKFADHLEKNGVNDVAIMQGNQHGTFYTRVETPAQLAALSKVLDAAQKKGLLSAEPLASGKILDPRIFNRVSSQATQDIIEQLRANRPLAPEGSDESLQPALDKAHGAQIQDLQRTLLSMTPETSMNRLMAHRQNVQGFSKDMLGSQAYAADISAFGLARRTLAHETSGFEAGMQKDLEAANHNPNVDLNTRLGLADTIGELMRGQRLRQTYVPKDWRDVIRQFTNFLHIGMSPAYFPMQLSQLAITGAPELAKLYGSGLSGYGPAFMAMKRAVSPTMQAIAAIVRSPDGLTAGVTREALEKKGLDPALINKIMGMELRGSLGSYTASVSEHPALTGTALKMANTLGMYSDLAPRIIMGLAADELYTAKGHPTLTREQAIDRAIGDSQGYYSTALGARQMGRGGFLGSYTPMTMQFQTWNINLTNKIYHEIYDAVKGEDAQTKKDARTWLAGHAAAVTMLSGTLGLPAVSMAASVYDKLMDLFTDRDDHDITASYRTFLADHFGKDMGEIIARGLPRATGVDFANWGEGEIIPGTASLKIFTEKRKWEDVERDWFKSMGGPALDQMFQIVPVIRDIMNGDYLEGLGRMAPGLISGPMKAYQLTKDGFVDSHGQKLPISSPNAAQYMLTALGLKPASLAEYHEVAREEFGLRAMREASSANISQHLQQAWTQGDQGAFNSWMGAAQKWQIEHPGMVPPQASFSRSLDLHLRQLAQARSTGLPIGVAPRDISGRGMLQYGNIPMQ